MAVTLPAVVEELLSEMAAAVKETARIPDEHLSSLKFIFGSSAIQALDLVDRQSITLISSPSGRHIYQVLGSSGKTYTCLASCHYCSCPAFAFSVLRKSESLLNSSLLPNNLQGTGNLISALLKHRLMKETGSKQVSIQICQS
ncbi:zinc finger SWIM domain-containing protein 7 isoform 1-T1 [Callospermophilus lateralis]|uniref:zinc finger SWIM domain-containing protein 7 isoform X1 n=1 Tax=Callospermophilus lateralis TaxID=76772 RepID=UPI0040387333